MALETLSDGDAPSPALMKLTIKQDHRSHYTHGADTLPGSTGDRLSPSVDRTFLP